MWIKKGYIHDMLSVGPLFMRYIYKDVQKSFNLRSASILRISNLGSHINPH